MPQHQILSGLKKQLKLSRHRPKKQISLGTLFGIVAIVFYASYHAGLKSVDSIKPVPSDNQQMIEEVNTLRSENELLKQQIETEKRNYQIQFEAQKSLSQHIKELEQKNSELSRDISLYERIRGTPQKASLEIKTFQIFSTDTHNKYRYLLLLSKDAHPEQVAQGSVQMKINGKLGTQNLSLPVRYADSAYQGLAFKFRNFQELSGELSFPEGFVPQSVTFDVKPLASSQFQQEFPWAL